MITNFGGCFLFPFLSDMLTTFNEMQAFEQEQNINAHIYLLNIGEAHTSYTRKEQKMHLRWKKVELLLKQEGEYTWVGRNMHDAFSKADMVAL